MKPLFTGTGTALITPFKNGEIDWDALDNLVESQIAGGVSALIAAGTTGEPSTMTWDEHIEVIRFVAERAKDRACVIAGTGSNCTREVIHAANVVKDFGVAAQLVVTPYYNQSTQEGLVAHYTEIAEKTSLPIVVYNVPSRTGVNIQPATLEKICRLPQVVAVKEANPDVARRRNLLLRQRRPDDSADGAGLPGRHFRAEQRHARRNEQDDVPRALRQLGGSVQDAARPAADGEGAVLRNQPDSLQGCYEHDGHVPQRTASAADSHAGSQPAEARRHYARLEADLIADLHLQMRLKAAIKTN